MVQIEIRNAQILSFREKQVVTMKESGLTTAQIAKRLHIAESTVATIFSRACSKGYEAVIIIPGDALGLLSYGEEDADDA